MAKLLEDLFLDTLKDIYFAEQKIVATLPEMEQAATNTHGARGEDLRRHPRDHRRGCRNHGRI